MSSERDYVDIRDAVTKLCGEFPGLYWQKLDEQRQYPTEFVQALSDAGYLSVLIPQEYGGSGLPLSAACAILEEIQRSGGPHVVYGRRYRRTTVAEIFSSRPSFAFCRRQARAPPL